MTDAGTGRPKLRVLDRKTLTRLGAEFLVIFASVVLALVADDWRQTRNERAAAERALQLVLLDLREDHGGLEIYQRRLQGQDSAAARFLDLLDEDATAEELATTVSDALNVWNYRPSYSAYRGLVQSGQLGLIREDTLRETVIRYHDEALPYLDDLRNNVVESADRAALLAERHFRRVPGPDTTRWDLRLVTSSDAVRRDAEFLGALGSAASARRWLAFRIGQIFLVFNAETAATIERYLDGKSPP